MFEGNLDHWEDCFFSFPEHFLMYDKLQQILDWCANEGHDVAITYSRKPNTLDSRDWREDVARAEVIDIEVIPPDGGGPKMVKAGDWCSQHGMFHPEGPLERGICGPEYWTALYKLREDV
jgi:hypothetical protein